MEVGGRFSRESSMIGKTSKKGLISYLSYQFKNLSLAHQLLTFFISFLVLYSSFLIFIKFNQIDVIFKSQNNKYYFQQFLREVLTKQQYLVSQITQVNIKEESIRDLRDSVFFKIYAREHVKHKLGFSTSSASMTSSQQTWKPASISPETLDKYTSSIIPLLTENGYSDRFKLSYDFNEHIKSKQSFISDTDFLNPEEISPLFMYYLPLMCQNSIMQKMYNSDFYLITANYISYVVTDTDYLQCRDDKLNTYMKYPKDADIKEQNNISPYDMVLDPVSQCGINSFITDVRKDFLKEENYYANFEKYLVEEKLSYLSDVLIINKMLDLENRNDYSIITSSFTIRDVTPGKIYVFSFIFRFYNYPTLSQNFFSVVQYNRYKNPKYQVMKGVDKTTEYYFKEYNIDDTGSIVFNIPLFLKNLFTFTNTLNLSFDKSTTDIIVGFKTSYLDLYLNQTYNKNINTNYYLQYDSNFFTFISFYMNYIRNFSLDSQKTCPIQNKEFYYKGLQGLINRTAEEEDSMKNKIDCQREVCLFYGNNSCSKNNTFYDEAIDYQVSELSNCYCFPFLCQTGPGNATYTDIMSSKQLANFNKLNSYFSDALPNKCNMQFSRISDKIKPYPFTVQMLFDKIDFSNNSNIFTVYFSNDTTIFDVFLKNQSLATQKLTTYLVIFYSVAMILVGIIMIKVMSRNINTMIYRIKKFDKIQKKIISNEQMVLNTEGNTLTMASINFTECDNPEDVAKFEEEQERLAEERKHEKTKTLENKKPKPLAENVEMEFVKDHNEAQSKEERDNIVNNLQIIGSQNKTKEIPPKDRKIEKNEKDDQEKEKKTMKYIEDELTELRKIFYNNLDSFKIELEIGQNIYKNNKLISKFLKEKKMNLYNDVVFQTDEDIKRKLDKQNTNNLLGDVMVESEGNVSTYSQNYETNDINLLLLYEVISTEIVDFANYKLNFYLRNPEKKIRRVSLNIFTGKTSMPNMFKNNSLFDFYESIERFLYDDDNNINDITNSEKVESWINYVLEEIYKKWIAKYEKTKLFQ